MSRPSFFTGRRLLAAAGTAAGVAAGVSATGATAFWFWMRKCQFEEFTPETDKLFQHPFLQKTNPNNNPAVRDMCVRRVPFSQLKPELLQDAQQGGSKLVEAFAGGMWARYGYALQLRIMQQFKDDTNKDDLWTKEDMLSSTYEPDTFVTHHFHFMEKSPQALTLRICLAPRQDPPAPIERDSLCELRAELNHKKQEAEFRMKCITFNGTESSPDQVDPSGGFGGWLHRQYVKLLVESAAGNCMK